MLVHEVLEYNSVSPNRVTLFRRIFPCSDLISFCDKVIIRGNSSSLRVVFVLILEAAPRKQEQFYIILFIVLSLNDITYTDINFEHDPCINVWA